MAVDRSRFDSAWQDKDELEVLTFQLNGEIFAIEASVVQEITDILPSTHVPGAPSHVSRIFNYRGRVIPLADIRQRFDMQPQDQTLDSRIVIVSLKLADEDVLVGIFTDKVYQVTHLARAACEPTPSVGLRWRPDFIQCLVKDQGQFIIFPDLETIFLSATANS